MAERYFYADADVMVSNEFVKIGANTYSLADIASTRVALRITPLKRNLRWWVSWCLLIGAIALTILRLFMEPVIGTFAYFALNCIQPVLVFGALFLPIRDFRYIVKLKGTFGQVDLLTKNRSYANEIVVAIKNARNWANSARDIARS